MEYAEDEMLMLSGIQHYMFCPRQWALIHIEQQWSDNRLTAEGSLLHQNVDDPFYRQKNGDTITLRSVQIASKRLGLYGLTDAVELIPSDNPAPRDALGVETRHAASCNSNEDDTITHPRYPGRWKPYPIEYKHGHVKRNECDEVQLAAQAMCLEEMYGIQILEGALFYAETRRREIITIDDELRALTVRLAAGMHDLYRRGETPAAVRCPHCRSCSLADLCMPQLAANRSVSSYLKENLYEKDA